MDYKQLRERIYEPMRREGIFTWDWMYGKEYALASVHFISRENRRELAWATEQLGKIFTKTVDVVRLDDALLIEMGIPREALASVKVSVLPEMPTVIGRFDFARTKDGYKMLEFNSDTPGGVVEGFYVNARVCDYYGLRDPNAGMEQQFGEIFPGIVKEYERLGYKTDSIFFSSLEWHEEDAGTTRYLLARSGLKAEFVPLKDIRVYNDNLYVLMGESPIPVDVLYRLHPLGILADEKDVDGYSTGAHVLDIIARRKLAVINPPGALIAQTKALQVLIWNLHEAGEFFDEAEHRVIEKYMLPTYFENRFSGKCPYVTKPILGREGGAVTVYGCNSEVAERAGGDEYWEQTMIYQQMAELEPIKVETLEGLYQGRLIWGSFLIGGQAAAIVARVGGLITDNYSYFLPVGLEK